jgi:LuxR family transcriptional regulator, maltose regulon positive regulatory protein
VTDVELYFSGSIDEARATFRWAAHLAEKIGDRRRRLYALGELALIAAESGQVADVEHQIRRTTGAGTDLAGGEQFVNAIVSLTAATRNEVSALLRGCADADLAQTVLTPIQRGRCAALSPRNQGDSIYGELTVREQEVLRLLATRLSRREIGQRLYVSLNTVKTHQRALYRKLGVVNRGAAVAHARELGLL